MCKMIVFAGTTEGNTVCRFLSDNQISVLACVATEYGSRSLEEGEYLHVQAGRLTQLEMEQLFQEKRPELVLDATHPYAALVTENIRNACEQTGVPYQRVLRESREAKMEAVYVDTAREAVEFLEHTEGNILLTTGSKELKLFTELTGYQERLYARVLSLPSVLETCRTYGIEGKHLIGMQGPFSRELNAAMLRQYDCCWLVTKDTGAAGGFQEKLDAARECQAVPVIIGRPLKETGLTVHACKKMLAERLGLEWKPQVTLLGIGMGSRETMTLEGMHAAEEADLLIGARRMVDAVRFPHQDFLYEYRSQVIADYIQAHPEYEKIVILLSGDVGFYSGARKLLDLLGKDTRIICGISSVVYFMAKIGQSWDDAKIVSSHGRSCGLVSLIRNHRKVFSIMGTEDGIAQLARKLTDYHMGDVLLYVGENLSYETEKIFVKTARELTDYRGSTLSVVCAYHEKAVPTASTHGIPDGEFIRGSAPMTKEEIRTVSLAKLQLREDSVCYDVGAGTGSVSIEMALRTPFGRVYAIEKKDEAAELIEQNKIKFAADNLEVIRGLAPSALCDLPVPSHAFVGGSSGNLRQILMLLVQKNPDVRVVINCITLETVTEAMEVIREFGFKTAEIVQLSVSRAKELGRYHLMMGENPIYIITCQNPVKWKQNMPEKESEA